MAGQQPFVLGNPILAIENLGPVLGSLAILGHEGNDPLVQRLTLEDDLAGDLVALGPLVAAAADCADGQRSQQEPENDCESAHDRPPDGPATGRRVPGMAST